MAETYYERLGVATDAGPEEIERAYRDRLKRTHPDVSDDPAAAQDTRRLIEARRVLTDDAERERYDRLGHDAYAGDTATTDGAATAGTETGSATAYSWTAEASTGGRQANKAAGSSASAARTGSTDRESRRRQNRETRAAWNTRGGVADGGAYAHEWRAWDTGAAYRVHPTGPSKLGKRLFPIGPSLVTLLVAFGLYPVLLWGSVEPAFPLPFNVLLGSCLLLMVGFLASMPPVGVAVFGTWTLLLPTLAVVPGGIALFSPAWILLVAGTTAPLVIAVATWAVLRA